MPNTFGCPLYIWMPPYVLMPLMSGWSPVCFDAPICLPVCLDAPFGCPLYIHNTKKACFVRLRGCPYAPWHLDAHICLDAPPVYLNAHMFGWPLYVWIPPVCLDAPHMCSSIWICKLAHLPMTQFWCTDSTFRWMALTYANEVEAVPCLQVGFKFSH